MVKRNLLSDRMQEIILRHTTFSPSVEWLSWGDLAEVMVCWYVFVNNLLLLLYIISARDFI